METTFRSQASTPVLIPNRFDTKQKITTYRTDAPPSPTLTNPDMILPDDGERQSSTPSPPFQLTPSNPHMRQNGLQQQNGGSGLYPSNGSAYRVARPRWTYEGHAPGRPLSDIGEEDSQASSPAHAGRYTSQTYQPKSDSDSDGSGSTISAGSQRQLRLEPEGLRGGGNDSGFNSERNGFASESSIERERTQASNVLTSEPSQQPEEDSSSAILSSEAERILENAKRRLTLMEGNLTRARSSIRLGQSPSPSPTSPGLLLPTRNLQPAGALYRSISQTDRRSSLLRPRPVYTTTQEGGHSRGHSETNLPSAASLKSPTLQPSRSMSALASPGSLHYDSRENSFPFNAADSNGSQESRQDSRQEDDNRRNYLSPDINGSAGLGISTSKTAPKMSSMDDFNSAYPPDGPPSRAQSQLQVRDLKDQAAGLRTKVALLKVKTQEDNLRRRSLQSLRTPSPFTAAERWYSSALEHGNRTANVHSNAGYGWVSETTETKQDSNGQSTSNSTDSTIDVPLNSQTHETTSEKSQHINDEFTFDNDGQSILESHYEDAEEGDYDDDDEEGDIDRERLNEILNEPFDDDDDNDIFEDFPTGTAPEATPHEEREDAFDYENFYLHSALGTFSRNKMRRDSYGSTGSTETTRPAQYHGPSRHGRNGSNDSVSTFATFATATENAYDDDDGYDDDQQDALHAIDRIVDNWNDFEDEEDGSTPVQSRRATVIDRSDESRYLEATRNRDNNGPFTPTRKMLSIDRNLSTPTTPVDAFMSSLSSRSASTRPPSSLNTDDTRLLEQVFESLGKVCTELQELTMAATATAGTNGTTTVGANGGTTPTAADPKYIRTLRRRLDAARRVLDGQLDSDA